MKSCRLSSDQLDQVARPVFDGAGAIAKWAILRSSGPGAAAPFITACQHAPTWRTVGNISTETAEAEQAQCHDLRQQSATCVDQVAAQARAERRRGYQTGGYQRPDCSEVSHAMDLWPQCTE